MVIQPLDLNFLICFDFYYVSSRGRKPVSQELPGLYPVMYNPAYR